MRIALIGIRVAAGRARPLLAVCLLGVPSLHAQTTSGAAARPIAPRPTATGLLVVAHGAGDEWNARVRETVSQVRWPHGPVALAFLMGPEAATAGWDAGVDTLLARGSATLVVVPLMVSSYGGHYREIEDYAAGRMSPSDHDAHPLRHRPPPVPTRVAPALDAAPELGQVLADRWAALDPPDRRRPLVLVAHGPNDDDDARRWVEGLGAARGALHRAGVAGEVRISLLHDDAPAPVRAAAVAALRDTVGALARASGDSVLVLPVLISSGSINRVKLPLDLADLPVRYVPAALTPHPALARWIERTGEQALEGGSPSR